MESLAYLHLAQDYESDETKELIGLQGLGSSIAQINFRSFSKATVSLLSAASATWILSSPYIALANGYVFEEYSSEQQPPAQQPPEQPSNSQGLTVIISNKYVKSYAGGGYYYILQEADFEDRPAYAVPESSYPTSDSSTYHPVRPKSTTPLCGVFKLGDSGSGVSCLQELLQKTGYFDGAITGYFGTKTCDAVIAFQRDHGLYVDGVAGSQTLEVLNQIAGR